MTAQRSVTTPAAVIAIGTSAGGLRALEVVLGTLPASLAVPVVVVQHLAPDHRSHLVDILRRHTVLEVRQAEDGDRLRSGVVYVAQPDHHLLVESEGTLHLQQSEQVHFARPSIDTLLKSVATAFGDRGIAVVLTGTGSDGASGVEAVGRCGGTVVVQDTETAEFPAMPAAAIATGHADLVVPLDEIAATLVELSEGPR